MADQESNTTENPHFKWVERAPYELGHLLQEIPADFSSYKLATPDTCAIAEAAVQHASNAQDTIIHGLEAIGNILWTAGANEQNDISKEDVKSIGCLIKHLACEVQFLHEFEENFKYILSEQKTSKSMVKS